MARDDPFATYRTHEWFESLAWQHRWIEYMVGWWIGQFGKPETVADFGAGDGWWSHTFKQAGSKDCFAVELDEIAREHTPPDVYFIQQDLREPTDKFGTVNLVMCLEVAEHLPRPAALNGLLPTLVKSTRDLIMFSAAQPGQAGTGHINSQTPGYWIEQFERWPYIKLSNTRTAEARKAFERIVPEGFKFLPDNLLVFAKV